MSTLRTPVSAQDHIQGDANAKIELVEYGDYQCPYCADFYYVVKELQKQLGKDLKFVFRNFPLDMHPNAGNAAIASEILAKHGKFWQMHDMLYENQDNLDYNSLIEYAKQLGVNKHEFEQDADNNQFANKVNADIESGLRSGVNGTPSLYINSKKYNGDYSLQGLLSYLKQL